MQYFLPETAALDLEQLASEVRERARLRPDEVELAPTIAERILGANSIGIVPALRNTGYLRELAPGRYRILVRPDNEDLNFTIAHEIGHWALRVLRAFTGDPVQEERAANYVAAAILAPAGLVRRAHAQFGEGLRTLARAFGLSQTAMFLRLAEVLGDDRVVVTRTNNVLIRMSGAFTWQPHAEIVRFARDPKRRSRAVGKRYLRGGPDEGRVALRALREQPQIAKTNPRESVILCDGVEVAEADEASGKLQTG